MIRFLRAVFDLRQGEGYKSSLMFLYGMLIIATVMILKPVCNTLFLKNENLGPGKLPYAFVLVAITSALVAAVYSRYSRKIRLNRLISWTLAISIACLMIFWILLHARVRQDWFFYAFYIWVALFSVFTGSQFWLLANDVYHARAAKRVFGFIGAGAIAGGIVGGLLTNVLAPYLGTNNLIFVCVGFILICQVLVTLIWRRSSHYLERKKRTTRSQRAAGSTASDNPLDIILGSRFLMYLTGIICVGVLVANLADYQFRVLADQTYAEADAMTAFFGLLLSAVNVFSLLVQLFLTSKILKLRGVMATLFFLPLGLLGGAVSLLIFPTMWSAVLLKISDGSFKHSINRSGMELLYLPIPPELKNKTKTFIDVVLKNAAKGAAGVGLAVLVMGLGLSIRHLSVLLIVLIALWLVLVRLLRPEYINSFRQAIEKRSIELEDLSLNLQDAEVVKTILKTLEGESERRLVYALSLLEDVTWPDLVEPLRRLIRHPSSEVRTMVLKTALRYPELDFSSEAEDLRVSPDVELQNSAVCYLYHTAEDKARTLGRFLESENHRVRVAATLCAAREWGENGEFRSGFDLQASLSSLLDTAQRQTTEKAEQTFIKVQVAKAVGYAQDRELDRFLRLLLQDASPDVIEAAVISVGQAPSTEFIPLLLGHLTTKNIRKKVRECLAGYGDDVIKVVDGLLLPDIPDRRLQLAIPKVLALIGSQQSVTLLWRAMEKRDPTFRFECIRALNKLRVTFPDLKFDHQIIQERLDEEIGMYGRLIKVWLRQYSILNQAAAEPDQGPSPRARALLTRALEEQLEKNLERIFRLLGLEYSPRDMLNAYLGLVSPSPQLRANAIEFLDNVLNPAQKKSLIELMEKSRPETLKKTGPPLRAPLPSDSEALEKMLEEDDQWLLACTIYLIAVLDLRGLLDRITPMSEAPRPLVRETALLCLQRLRASIPIDAR
jgi:AAA family ATP:ADP antiporter